MLVIPAIDLIEGSCVRLIQGDYKARLDYDVHPLEQALQFQELGFERVHIVDLDGAKKGEICNLPVIREVAEGLKIPVQVGGGIRTDEEVGSILEIDRSFLILGTIVLQEPNKVEDWICRWGADRIIVSLDLKKGRLLGQGWTENAAMSFQEAVKLVVGWGVRQIICSDIGRDGTLQGPDYRFFRNIVEEIPREIQVISAGGVSHPDQINRLADTGLSGAIVGRALYEGAVSLREFANVS